MPIAAFFENLKLNQDRRMSANGVGKWNSFIQPLEKPETA